MEQKINAAAPEMSADNQNRRPISVVILLTVISVALLVVASTFLFDRNAPRSPDGESITNPYEALLQNNEEFSRAESFLKNNQLDLAEEHFRSALPLARDANEEGQTLYKIALTNTRSDPAEAIAILKDIASSTRYSNIQRAYALQRMGELFYKNSSHEITELIFTGVPYASFLEEGDEKLAYRRLYEHASSFYPLAVSELRVGLWYADEILKLAQKKSLSSQEKQLVVKYTEFVRASLEMTDRDIERTRNALNAGDLVPGALARKAALLAMMREAGDLSFADPEPIFKDAMELGLVRNSDPTPRYYYAVYLAKTAGESRKADIVDLLDNFYNESDAYEGMIGVFTKEKNNVLGNKKDIARLANIDPAFKALLRTLGWSEADFKL